MQIASNEAQFNSLSSLMSLATRLSAAQYVVPVFSNILEETGARKNDEFFIHSVGDKRLAIHEDNKPKLEVDFKYLTNDNDTVRKATLHVIMLPNNRYLSSISGMY